MLKHVICKLGRNFVLQDSLACYRNSRASLNITIARHFSNELTNNWPQGIKQFLERENIRQPTPIQEKTIPFAVDKKNLVGIARTGSGKTLAFVIPAVIKILKQIAKTGDETEPRSTSCLILAPTRELASQIHEVVTKFRHLGVSSIPLVGGSSRSEQVRRLTDRSHDIYIATPGRLMDLVNDQIVSLSHIDYLVLDEADRMLDMGFEPQIRSIVEQIPENRQTLMFSATWPEEIQSLASEFLNNYEYVAVDSEILKANPNIKQIVEICQPHEKLSTLIKHMKQFEQEYEEPRSLIFVNTKRLADSLLVQLMRNRMKAIALHGDRSQNQRDNAMRLFRNRLCHIMVATDVAARGLDINDISHVINYDFPNTIEDYIHRIGRTARHEKKGTALTLFTVENVNIAPKLVRILRETGQEVPSELQDLARNRHKYHVETKNFNNRRNFYLSGARY